LESATANPHQVKSSLDLESVCTVQIQTVSKI